MSKPLLATNYYKLPLFRQVSDTSQCLNRDIKKMQVTFHWSLLGGDIMDYSWHFMPFWGHILMMLFWVGLFVLMINYRPNDSNKESSLEVAKKRYAQGEIGEEQFNKIKQSL